MFLFLAFKADVVEGGATIGTTALVYWQLHSSLYTVQVVYRVIGVHPTGLTVDQGWRQVSTMSKFWPFGTHFFPAKIAVYCRVKRGANCLFPCLCPCLESMPSLAHDMTIPYLYSVPRTCDNRIFLFERITFNAFFSLLPTINLQCLPFFSATL